MVNRVLFVDNSISNSDWTKANAFDFPNLKTVEDFEQQFNIPSEEPARSERLARLAVLPWVRVAPAPVRELLEGFKKQSLVSLLKASFGGDRSEAGRYAANVRWQGNVKGDDKKYSKELTTKEMVNILYEAKSVQDALGLIAKSLGKDAKPQLRVLDDSEVTHYRGASDPTASIGFVLDWSLNDIPYATWGQGLYITPLREEASIYGKPYRVNLDKSAKLIIDEVPWSEGDKWLKVKSSEPYESSKVVNYSKLKFNPSGSDLINFYWASKGYDGAFIQGDEVVLFNGSKLTVDKRDLSSKEIKKFLTNLVKASFGGDRSEAGRYAANIRWQGNRKGDEGGSPPPNSLKEQIDETASLLLSVSKLSNSLSDKDYETNRERFYTQVKIRGKNLTVPSIAVMEAEAQVNGLGKRVLDEAGQKVVESGFCTQQELDDAIAYQSRPSEKDAKAGLAKSLVDRAMDKDPKVYPLVKDAVDEYERLKIEAKVAKGLLIKATKEYKKTTAEQGYTQDARQAYQIRVEMQRANVMAKYELNRAQQVLDARLSDLSFDDDAPLSSLRTEIQQAGSAFRSENHQRYLDIYREVGQEVKKTIGQYRPMAQKYPVTIDTLGAPQSAIEIIAGLQGKDLSNGKQQKIIAEVTSRFPQSLLAKIPSDVKVQVRSRSGGNWSESQQRIVTDMEDADTFTHETIHALTFFSRSMRLMEQAALSRRTWGKSGDLTTPMTDKVKEGRQKVVGPTKAGLPYSRGQYIPDDFSDPYQGRIYNDRYTETLTVATENLFGGGTKLRGTGRADRDLMATALGALLTAESQDD